MLMDRSTLERLSKQELVEAYLELQGNSRRPPKTSRTSSKPPSTDRKARREKSKPGGAKPGHLGHSRSLHDTPDEVVDHRPAACTNCNAALGGDLPVEVIGEYDEIDLPPIAPLVRRHRRVGVCCPNCHARVKGELPAAATGTPFGPRLHALALYLKTYQPVSFARLAAMFREVFGVKVSQGALANMLKRSHLSFEAARQEIIDTLRKANVVASDETGVRIEGSHAYHRVFMRAGAVVHEVQHSRTAQVVRDIMGAHRPKVWLSDGYSAQQKRGDHHQTCLAHLARDIAYGVEASQDRLPFNLKLWMDRVFALAQDVTSYAASTINSKKRELERNLAELLSISSNCPYAEDLRGKMARASPKLLTFLDFPGEVDATNNGCERALRPSVTQRKVTNGFRSMWVAEGDCAVRSVADTAKLRGQSPWETIKLTLA